MHAVEQHIHLLAASLGKDLPQEKTSLGTTARPGAVNTFSGQASESVLQQLADMRAQLASLTQTQQQGSSQAYSSGEASTKEANPKQSPSGQECAAQQIPRVHADGLQPAASVQKDLAAQEKLTEDLRQTQQSVSCMNADLERHVREMQHTCSQVEAQHSSRLSQMAEGMSQYHRELAELKAASSDHAEQVSQHRQTLTAHEEQLAGSAALQAAAQETLQRLERTEADGAKCRAAGMLSSFGKHLYTTGTILALL